MTLSNVQRWNIDDLKEWLKKHSTMESDRYEFKSQLPIRDNEGKRNLSQVFCAFANTKGGFIFFGIENDKTATGIVYDSEFKTRLSQILNSSILPSIPKWDIINSIQVSASNSVFIAFIPESPHFLKPHITCRSVFVRRHGVNEALTDGAALRRILELEKFSPNCIETLELEFQKIESLRFNPQELDFMYLLQLRQYLEKRSELDGLFNKLVEDLRSITKDYYEVKRLKSSQDIRRGEGDGPIEEQELSRKVKELSAKTSDFIKSFKVAHAL